MNESAAVHRGDPGLPGSRVLLADFGVGFVVAAVILGVLGVLLVSDQPGGDVLAGC